MSVPVRAPAHGILLSPCVTCPHPSPRSRSTGRRVPKARAGCLVAGATDRLTAAAWFLLPPDHNGIVDDRALSPLRK